MAHPFLQRRARVAHVCVCVFGAGLGPLLPAGSETGPELTGGCRGLQEAPPCAPHPQGSSCSHPVPWAGAVPPPLHPCQSQRRSQPCCCCLPPQSPALLFFLLLFFLCISHHRAGAEAAGVESCRGFFRQLKPHFCASPGANSSRAAAAPRCGTGAGSKTRAAPSRSWG